MPLAYIQLVGLPRAVSCCGPQCGDLIADLSYRHEKVWKETDTLSPREENRKAMSIVGAENH
eukprot:856172-Pelagomonas_calceolata.AAC.1